MNTHLSKKIITVATAVAFSTLGLINPATATAADTGQQKMYRMYNYISGEHLYTADTNERDTLRKGDWLYEGVAWIAPIKSSTPVIRLYNPGLGDHHYTTDQHEVKVLTSKYGWKNEGIGWYSSDSHKVTVYRQFNPGLRTGSHNYTTDQNEYNVNNARNGWRGEGVAWYALDKGWQEADGLNPNAVQDKINKKKAEEAKNNYTIIDGYYKVWGKPKLVISYPEFQKRVKAGNYIDGHIGYCSSEWETNKCFFYNTYDEAAKAGEMYPIFHPQEEKLAGCISAQYYHDLWNKPGPRPTCDHLVYK